MYKKQMLTQRIVCYVLLFAAVLVFIYSLGLVTDLHYNNFNLYAEDPKHPYFEGAEIYNDIQPFNSQLTTLGITLILSVALLFVFGTQNRRKYYIGNYITIGIHAALSVFTAVFGIINVIKYKEAYLKIDFEALKWWQQELELPYDISPFWFDIGPIVFGILLFATLLSILNLIFKVYVMRGEKRLLIGEEANNG